MAVRITKKVVVPQRVLCLDLGTKCGYAISLAESGVLDLTRKRFEGGGMIFVRFRQKLRELLDSGVTAVYYEEVRRHLGTDAAHLYGGFQAVLTEECEARNIPYAGVPVSKIKQVATGKGNSNKEAMVAAAAALGWPSTSEDQVDALFLLRAVQSGAC